MFWGCGKPPCQKPQMGNEDPCGFGCCGSFEVFGETSASAAPCQCPLDHPAPRQKLEAFDARWALYDFNSPRGSALRESVLELLAAVDAVSKDVSQLGKAAAQLLQQWNGAMAVLNIGWMDIDGEQKAIGVGDDMPLTPVNTFAGVVASWAPGVGRRCALAIDDPGGRCRLAPKFAAGLADQGFDNFLASPGIAPRIKIALNCRIRRKILRQRPPLTSRRQKEEDCLHHLAQVHLPGATQMPSRRHPAGNQRPLRIGQIACIAQSTTPILLTSGFSPWHGALPRIFANPKESQPAEITHCFFGQALRMTAVCAARVSAYPAFAFSPAASMPAMAQISSLSEVSPLTPTAPTST